MQQVSQTKIELNPDQCMETYVVLDFVSAG